MPNGFMVSPSLDGKVYQTFNVGGYHDFYGIFLAYGKGIKKGYRIHKAKIYDLAPTILHIFGLPIPNDMDGRVLTEIFEKDCELLEYSPVYVDCGYYTKTTRKDKSRSKIMMTT